MFRFDFIWRPSSNISHLVEKYWTGICSINLNWFAKLFVICFIVYALYNNFLENYDKFSVPSLAFCKCGTLQVNGYGIDSMASFFLDYGYTPQEELRFPVKKLKALWFSPPRNSFPGNGSGIYGPLPRVFISELLVDEMSAQAQVSQRTFINYCPFFIHAVCLI